MSERYYWSRDETHDLVPQTAELSGDEAHHLTRVMRRKCGDLVTLFDGNGREFHAEITDTQKDRVALWILETRIVDTEPQLQVTIAVSLPKGDRQKWLVEKLTELGCHRLIPLQTERGVAQCSDQVLERLRRQVIEATKQCNRTRLMQISPECGLQASDFRDQDSGLIAHPCSGGTFGQWDLLRLIQYLGTLANASCSELSCSKTSLPKNVLALVGPEGGFTRQEVEQAVTLGLQPLDLGPRIMRVETAAIMLAAILVNSMYQ